MEEMYKQLDSLKNKVVKELEKINMKPEMNPTELKNATDAVCLLEKIKSIQNDDSEEYYEDSRYSRNGRARSSMTSRRMDHGYSSHSIHDRIVDKLERMMDEAGSDYEREVISKWIRKIESE